ncbi:Crp/Fnr family transcriptional regulator [Clostridium omnivorum]|uniref:Crp/Fnr family transcriptional regulator n=1 Tax=Clostridium omnivorum TaxID=1604902 RepID=A0ABQ5N2U9_9CLOT|nr:Crp/Fnr family transcriptional regulator [Clostridium sp. E14]GLC29533.1 Crp/Fnr family transcriptional regulator [Clostridium sp. E14]
MEAIKINIDEYINAISSLNIFSSFTKDELRKVFSSSKYEIKEYGKEQIIHLQNELCSTMDIILNGQASVQNIDENGNILKINTFTSKDIIGVNLIFARRNYYPMTVVAASKVTMLHMEKELILELCSNRNFMIELMTAISDKTIILTDKIKTISMKTIRQCIIDFIKYEYHIQNSNVIKLNTSKKDLAERLGIQRSSLSRELNKMRRDGLLEYDARTITLKNIDI